MVTSSELTVASVDAADRCSSYRWTLRRVPGWLAPLGSDRTLLRPKRIGFRALAADLTLLAILSTVTLVVTYQLWDASVRIPFGYGGDGLFFGANAKTIIQTGWVQLRIDLVRRSVRNCTTSRSVGTMATMSL